MYWFRDNFLYFIPWLIVMLITWFGGWLATSRIFRLKSQENIFVSFGIGLFIYIFFVNICGYFLPAPITFILPAFITLIFGFLTNYRNKKFQLDWKDLGHWKLLLFGLLFALFMVRMEQGLAISDDPKNITLISQLATGDIPPKFYLDGSKFFSTHYSFHLIGASMMSVGNVMPWSAFDLSKALVASYSLILIYLISLRYVKYPYQAILVVALFTVVGGTRWLFFLIPQNLIQPLDGLITLQGTSANMNLPFTQAIFQKWTLDGGPPLEYIFGFLNSLNGFFFNSHSGGLAEIALSIIWLTLGQTKKYLSYLIYIPLLAMFALSTETAFVFFALGVLGITIWAFVSRKPNKSVEIGLCLALLLSSPIIAVQGGYITEKVEKVLTGKWIVSASEPEIFSEISSDDSNNISDFEILNFSIRWPPGFPNAHLGELSLTEPLLLLTALIEIGPFLLIVPWLIIFAWRKYRDGDVYWGIITIASVLAFLFPIFVKYYVDRDITKIMAVALGNWKYQLLLFIWVSVVSQGWKRHIQHAVRYFSIFSVIIAAMGGIVVSIFNFSAISKPVLSYNINSLDAYVSSETWNKLDNSYLIFDRMRWRASMLTGLKTEFGSTKDGKPEWNLINNAATIENMAAAGYRYAYIDKIWWYELPESSRESLSQSCVKIIAEYVDDWPLEVPDFRRLIDISECIK